MDVGLSSIGLVVLSPFLLLIAAAIKLSDGGRILYRQTRIGLNGRRFMIIKFRTMNLDAEEHLGAVWAVPNDPRCTRLGLILRRCGFDELPQLWNIVRGDMSLVGPRPERPEFARDLRKEYPGYNARHAVRSGLTGFAQIHGWRGYTSIEDRLRHDLFYIQHWSLILDFKVLALTLIRGWSERTRNGI